MHQQLNRDHRVRHLVDRQDHHFHHVPQIRRHQDHQIHLEHQIHRGEKIDMVNLHRRHVNHVHPDHQVRQVHRDDLVVLVLHLVVVALQILVELILVAVPPSVDVVLDESSDHVVVSAGAGLLMYQKDYYQFAVALAVGYLVLVHLVAVAVVKQVLGEVPVALE